jgi:hypothetical protein
VSNFKETNKKLITELYRVVMTMKTISEYTQKVLVKMFRPSKIYPSRDTVPVRVLEQVWSLQWLWAPSTSKNGILPHYQTQFFFRIIAGPGLSWNK